MPSNFEQLVFEIIATDRNASAAFDRFRQKVDQTSRSVDDSSKAMDRSQGSLDNLGKSAEKAAGSGGASGLSALIGTGGGGGMAALIGAGVALSPVIATLGVGMGGLGVAAYGVAKPILNAAQATGGLSANMAKLNPEQRQVAQGLIGLGQQFGMFQKSLQPQVLGIFNQGILLAGHLLDNIRPVAKATGIALGGMLGQIDAEFQSGTWQQFFGFMARTAAPDVALLTKTFVNLQAALPPLLQLLQPVATDVLGISAGFSKLIAVSAQAGQGIDQTGQHMNFLEKITAGLRTVLFAPGVGLLDALKATGVISSGPASKGIAAMGGVAVNAHDKLLALNLAADKLSATWASTPAKAAPATDAITRMAGAEQIAFAKAGPVTDQITRLATSAQTGAGRVKPLTDQITMTAAAAQAATRNAGPLTDVISRLALPAKGTAEKLVSVANAITAINTAESKALALATAYAGSLVTTANDAAALEKALDNSHDKVGLLTAAQRASFGAANTYITDLGAQATQARASGHGVDAAITAIRNGLPVLEQAKTKNKAYWQEVQTLVGWLHTLENIKAIHENVFVSGSGTFTVRAGSKLGLPGGTAGGPFPQGAAGLFVRHGTTPTADDVIARVSKGELVVPAKMVSAGLVDHLRGAIPGFASGGLVPSYSGSVAGLPPWGGRDLNATVRIIEQATAKATFAAMKAAAAQASAVGLPGGHGAIGGGVQQWANLVLVVLKMLGQPAGDLGTVLSQMTTESGGNPRAINLTDSNAAAGDPSRGLMQVIGSTFNAYAGQFRNRGIYDPLANIYAGLNYAIHRYGSGWTSVLGHGHGYDYGGWLPTGASLAVNTTGQPERVTSPGQETAMLAALSRIERLLAAAPARTGDAVGGALTGASRSAARAGRYSTRGA